MTILQHHRPALQEGLCDRCTAEYRRDPEEYLDIAFLVGPMIDNELCQRFQRWHAGGHR